MIVTERVKFEFASAHVLSEMPREASAFEETEIDGIPYCRLILEDTDFSRRLLDQVGIAYWTEAFYDRYRDN